jgi:XTP/dITP diphosphohydrolase
MTVWLASGNAHKKAELAAILNGHEGTHEILLPGDAGILAFDPPETGSSFTENALIKARALHEMLAAGNVQPGTGGEAGSSRRPGRDFGPVIADDSGLCVDVLEGRPGIFSARYGGKGISAAERNALLLDEVAAKLGIEGEAGNAGASGSAGGAAGAGGGGPARCRFVCAMVLLFSPERFSIVQETMEGELVPGIGAARGEGGFGYDPIVFIPSLNRTVAELSEDEKNRLSHRGKAGRLIAHLLENQYH